MEEKRQDKDNQDGSDPDAFFDAANGIANELRLVLIIVDRESFRQSCLELFDLFRDIVRYGTGIKVGLFVDIDEQSGGAIL